MISHKVFTCLGTLLLLVATEKSRADTPEQNNARHRELAGADARREREIRERERAQTRAETEAQVTDERRNLVKEMHKLEKELIEERMRRVDLKAARTAILGSVDWSDEEDKEKQLKEVSAIDRKLTNLREGLERRKLQLELRRSEFNWQAERHDMRRMRDRLQYVSDWRSVAFDPQEAVMMGTQAVVESAFVGGGLERAVELLEGLLGEIHDVGSRTAIRFALRDLYGESGQPDVATEHLKQIILENARGLDGDHDGDRQ